MEKKSHTAFNLKLSSPQNSGNIVTHEAEASCLGNADGSATFNYLAQWREEGQRLMHKTGFYK